MRRIINPARCSPALRYTLKNHDLKGIRVIRIREREKTDCACMQALLSDQKY